MAGPTATDFPLVHVRTELLWTIVAFARAACGHSSVRECWWGFLCDVSRHRCREKKPYNPFEEDDDNDDEVDERPSDM